MKKPLHTDPDFVTWARRATAGLNKSAVMIGVWSKGAAAPPRLEFALQIGHCLLEDKPLLLVVAAGTAIPAKLEAAATVVEYFDPAIGEASLYAATTRALERVGLPREH
jgi:hypothetical protein